MIRSNGLGDYLDTLISSTEAPVPQPKSDQALQSLRAQLQQAWGSKITIDDSGQK